MADVKEVEKLKVDQLKELAEKHNVEVASSDKKDDLVLKVSEAITPEDLEAYNGTQPDQSGDEGQDEGEVTPVGTGDADGSDENSEVSQVEPPVSTDTAAATEEAHEANNQVNPAMTAEEVREKELEETVAKDEAHKAAAEEVDVDASDAPEEEAAKRAGVPKERFSGATVGEVRAQATEENEEGEVIEKGHTNFQNRAPKNQFEVENQKVTEQERKAAQERSNMSTSDRVENSETPNETAQKDAENTANVNAGSEIAQAIASGLKDAKGGNFKIQADAGVDPRFSLVKNKNGDVLLRENETGHLSQLQLKSIEEKEANLQDQEVEEL